MIGVIGFFVGVVCGMVVLLFFISAKFQNDRIDAWEARNLMKGKENANEK